jgi:ADP-ribose pyrophosphatase YjhB (NUDIX family)
MTREELFDILSLNFEQMWYRIWLTADNRDLYNKKYAKFQSTFMRDDGGAALRRAVMVARAAGVFLWEVPRGRRLNAREADIICATRELYEETGVEKSEYRLLPGVKRRVSYVSSGTRYICAYYVALANPHLAHAAIYDDPSRPTLREINYMAEVSEARWLDIEQIRLIDAADSRLGALVAPAFKLVKQYLKGNWAARRLPAMTDMATPAAMEALATPPPVSAPRGKTPSCRQHDVSDWRTVGRPQGKKRPPATHLTLGTGSLAPPAR